MKKKIIIIAVIVFLLLALGVGGYFIFGNKDKKDDKTKSNTKSKTTITITLDADGGTEVEPMKVKKGEKFELPKTEKKGYFFQGWFDGEVYYSDEDTDKLEKDTTLKALWANPDTTEGDVELKVVFDSKGGSKVKDMTFKCSDGVAILKNLPKSKKDSYDFLSWEDKHGKSILDGAKIMCDGSSLKLYAVWEYDGPVANPDNDPTPTPVKEKTYKCPDGYKLEDKTKCVKLATKVSTCESGKYSEKADKCYSYYSDSTKVCTSYKGYQNGKYFDDNHGHYGCAYGSLDSYPTPTTCSGHGTWSEDAPSPHCWSYVVMGSSNVTNQCPSGKSYQTATTLGGTQNSGCYTLTNPTKKCPEGYTSYSVYGECALIKDATYE